MADSAELIELTDEQREIVATVRDFVDTEVIPVADELEHRDEYPEKIVEQMKEMGLFGLTAPEEYGGGAPRLLTDAPLRGQLSRGGVSLTGPINTHLIGSFLPQEYGTQEQKTTGQP